MGSKGPRYIVLPAYIVNIGLLYALLLTSGLLLAWVTIYRHEKCIDQLKQMLNNKQATGQKHQLSTPMGVRGDLGKLDEIDREQQTFVVDDSSKRPRRHLDSQPSPGPKNIGTRQYLNSEKGEKGSEGRKGRRGKKGFQGERGTTGIKGEKGDTGKHGQNGRDGQRGDPGLRGNKGDVGVKGHNGHRGFPGRQGHRGMSGKQGEKGSIGADGAKGVGQKGVNGHKGDIGTIGPKGDKGKDGIFGIKGSKGNQGRPGQTIMHSESAHIVGTGRRIKPSPGPSMRNPINSWKKKYSSGNMYYRNGYLNVVVEGYYFIYSQMFYYDGNGAVIGHLMYIDNQKVLKTIHSVANQSNKFQTQFTGGVFKILKGQKIYVAVPFAKYYYFTETESFFGAFYLHS